MEKLIIDTNIFNRVLYYYHLDLDTFKIKFIEHIHDNDNQKSKDSIIKKISDYLDFDIIK